MIPANIADAIRSAVRLLRESGRHFKSRQVAEARRLLEQALSEMEHHDMSLSDYEIEPPDEEPECTLDVWTCQCPQHVQEWIDTYADAMCEERKEQV